MSLKKFFFYILTFIFLQFSISANAQFVNGITNEKDTSFTSHSAFIKTKKTHPFISFPSVEKSKKIKIEKNVVYCRIKNRELITDIFYPKKNKFKTPAIIFLHGGGWRSGNKEMHHDLAESLANKGFACFTPEYRLSTEAIFPAAVYDVKSMIRWVKSHAKNFNIDISKIVIAGFSAGGELASFVANTNGNFVYEGNENCNNSFSSNVHALINVDGTLSFVHPESAEGDDSKKISAATYWLGQSKKNNLELWQEASPLNHAGKNSVPTLFINSSVERMHAGRDDYRKILKNYGKYTEVKTFENSPHTFCLFNPWFENTVDYMNDFVKKIFDKK